MKKNTGTDDPAMSGTDDPAMSGVDAEADEECLKIGINPAIAAMLFDDLTPLTVRLLKRVLSDDAEPDDRAIGEGVVIEGTAVDITPDGKRVIEDRTK